MSEQEIESLKAFADCDMNIKAAAQKLYVHSNTLRYRLRKIKEATGLNPRRFFDLVVLCTRFNLWPCQELHGKQEDV